MAAPLKNIWSLVEDIRHKKSNLYASNPEQAEKLYIPYVVNKALSYHVDCILIVNEMNNRPWIPSKSQYDFLINIVRPRKVFEKWLKRQYSDDIETIKLYYKCSDRKANQIISVLSKQQLSHLRQKINQGGRK